MPEDHYPAISRDGTKVAYSVSHRTARCPSSSSLRAAGRRIESATTVATSKSGRRRRPDLYVTARDPSGVGLLTVGSSHNDAGCSIPSYGIYNPRLSSDGGWIAFNARTDRLAPATVFVARCTVRRRGESGMDRGQPGWRGAKLVAGRTVSCTPGPIATALRASWAQRLDPVTKQPIGTPLSIQHFHDQGLSWKNLYLGAPGIAVARDKIVFNLGEHTGNSG